MGDAAAFTDLYDAIAPRLLGFLRKAAPNGGTAKDLVQPAVLQMYALRVVLRAVGEVS